MRLVFLGPPGAGKGTQASLLWDRFQVAHLSSGDLLREAVRRRDPMGLKAADYIEAGTLVPDPLVTELVLSAIRGLSKESPFTLDGFPRTVEQARALDETLALEGFSPVDLVVDFEVSEETVVSRLGGRRVCESCGAIYHVITLPPQRQDTCDRCQGALTLRSDDQPETIRRRLKVYQESTQPLLDLYRAQGKYRKISGELKIEEQFQALVDLLKAEGFLR